MNNRVAPDINPSQDKIILESFKELRERLNGVCGDTCPREIAVYHFNLFLYGEDKVCCICKNEFGFLSCVDDREMCPCYRGINPEELFLRLDELIEELEDKGDVE